MIQNYSKAIFLAVALVFLAMPGFSQKRVIKKPAKLAAKSLIMAVLNDGKTVEPIAYIDKGKLTAPIGGGDDRVLITAFNKANYPVGKAYTLYFGGAAVGSVTIKSSDATNECSANTAEVTSKTSRTALKGNVMALATNATLAKPGSGVRRLPTAAERAEIEALVRAELAKNNVPAAVLKSLKYQNLTALDVDGDGKIELVGSFWVEPSETQRALLAFIADKASDGKYSFGFADFKLVEKNEVMSGDMKDVDSGVYHERLLDIFDVDGDGVSEVFTYVMSFEGAGFNVYKRTGGEWKSIFEGSNYHCGY